MALRTTFHLRSSFLQGIAKKLPRVAGNSFSLFVSTELSGKAHDTIDTIVGKDYQQE